MSEVHLEQAAWPCEAKLSPCSIPRESKHPKRRAKREEEYAARNEPSSHSCEDYCQLSRLNFYKSFRKHVLLSDSECLVYSLQCIGCNVQRLQRFHHPSHIFTGDQTPTRSNLVTMKGNSELVFAKNIYCVAAIVVLASSLVGSASGTTHKISGSCLSYGHSCWGAHGKRSGGNVIGALRPADGSVGVQSRRQSPLDERWLLSRLVDRQLMQVPLATKLRAARILNEDSIKVDKIDRNAELKDLARSDQMLADDEPDNPLIPDQRDLSKNDNDRAIKAGFYKILRNID
ncbi:uncharacterized protein LOC131662892 [Phymastichus coffea]|uniref:uncharacterized protein LOC131662892 n=1 Tax=Phymastichus coffea TaxID=108790 RepID=UPI00273BCD94|nr:uncharacterized protein LOC131662892 [Phymastichus coffea]